MDPIKIKNRPKILYIEDTPDSRALIGRLLEQDYIFLEAATPLAGIELALDTQPDLILLDLNLPDMSGYEVATRFTTLLPNTPLVAVTADASEGARERALIAGCAGFLTKPIDIDVFYDQLASYLAGKKESVVDSDLSAQDYQAYLVEHLESKVRELSKQVERNAYLNQQNVHVIGELRHRQRFMEASARVSQTITSILELQPLLDQTVSIICHEFDVYFAGILLRDANSPSELRLRAGSLQGGAGLDAVDYPVGSLESGDPIAQTCHSSEPVLIEDFEATDYQPVASLPETEAVLALPLIFNRQILGALVVHSRFAHVFGEANLTALRGVADQVAVAIRNAELLTQLESATADLIRSQTLEVIATATSEAIHWVGNRAAPIASSTTRVLEDLNVLMALSAVAISNPEHDWADLLAERLAELDAGQLNIIVKQLNQLSPRQLRAQGRPASIIEDLDIISSSAASILDIKEGLLGPARQLSNETVTLEAICRQAIEKLGLSGAAIDLDVRQAEIKVQADRVQLERVLSNLLKNAWEALDGTPEPHIQVSVGIDAEWGLITVADNGPGIPEDLQHKIWGSFFTTKSDRGGTGLGLAACLSIIKQMGGEIGVESQFGHGATFFIRLALPAQTDRALAA
jgi:signal transduction histidine kinase/DNA-binding response OmpR family regulator